MATTWIMYYSEMARLKVRPIDGEIMSTKKIDGVDECGLNILDDEYACNQSSPELKSSSELVDSELDLSPPCSSRYPR